MSCPMYLLRSGVPPTVDCTQPVYGAALYHLCCPAMLIPDTLFLLCSREEVDDIISFFYCKWQGPMRIKWQGLMTRNKWQGLMAASCNENKFNELLPENRVIISCVTLFVCVCYLCSSTCIISMYIYMYIYIFVYKEEITRFFVFGEFFYLFKTK